MNILIIGVDKFTSSYGGGEVYTKDLTIGLANHDVKVSYLSASGSEVAKPSLRNYSKNIFKEYELILPSRWIKESSKNEIINAFSNLFKTIMPDVIHAHAWKEYACAAASKYDIPCVVTVHHGGFVCPAGALLNHNDEICTAAANFEICLPCCVRNIPGSKFWLAFLRLLSVNFQLRIGRWLRTKRFFYFVTPLGTTILSIYDKLNSIKILDKYATHFIAPSQAISNALIRNGISKNKIAVIPHGIPLPKRQPLSPDFGKSALRFIFVGRISYVKGVHVMLEAFSHLKQESYELHIVGGAVTKSERRYMADLQNKFKSLNVIWHGNQPHHDIPKYIAQCDVMVHPAIFLEVFGLTIAEALAVGRPVIASRCGGAEMQISDGENGFLVPQNDHATLAKRIEYLLHNPAEILRLASNIWPVRSLAAHVQDILAIYREVI